MLKSYKVTPALLSQVGLLCHKNLRMVSFRWRHLKDNATLISSLKGSGSQIKDVLAIRISGVRQNYTATVG